MTGIKVAPTETWLEPLVWELVWTDGDVYRRFSRDRAWEIDLVGPRGEDGHRFVAPLAYKTRAAAQEAGELIKRALELQHVEAADPATCAHLTTHYARYTRSKPVLVECLDCNAILGEATV